uniref:Nuclear nucleic acid-binding protein C1D n=1 Tax=Heterorhabditis bacteriophora TaxID=37862 RepID=A0A1I7XG26_HETBA
MNYSNMTDVLECSELNAGNGIPPVVIESLKKFNEALTSLEDALEPHLHLTFEEHLERPALEMAQIDIMTLFTLNSLSWSLLAMHGKDPKENQQLSDELRRTKEYVSRLKSIERRKQAPHVNQSAAKV